MTRIAYLVTSAREMTLADGTPHPTGYFAEEALKPYQRFVDAGFDVTVTHARRPAAARGPVRAVWFFHYPDEDKDYLASVVRTFARDVDDIRLTLHQNTELGLAAARRVAALLQANGHTAAEAHRIVSAAAKTAWRQDRPFAMCLPKTSARRGHLARADPGADRPRGRRAAGRQPAAVGRAAPSAAGDSRLPAPGRAVLADRRGDGRVQRGLRTGRPRADGRPVR